MNTAQMTQPMPRMVNDIHPPMPATAQPQPQPQPQPAAQPSVQPELVSNLPVQSQNNQKSAAFRSIMSEDSPHDAAKPPISDDVLHQASHAVQAQEHVDSKAKKSKPGRRASSGQPKPILETVLLITGCLIACAVVAVLFSAS